MAETHELRLKINAGAAKSGAREFTAAVNAVKQAVRDLDRDASGAFTKLKNASPKVDVSGLKAATREANNTAKATNTAERAAERMAEQMKRTALSSAASLRVSQNETQRLTERFAALGETDSIDRLNRELMQLKTNLTASQSALDVRTARSSFADTSAELKRLANDLEAEARAHRQAADAAHSHSERLENLAQKYDPIRANSMRYAASLQEIETLEKAGVLSSATAAQARERASQALLSASAANTAFADSSRHAGLAAQQMGYQINDVFTMAALGASPMQVVASQLFQVTQAMEMAGGKAQALNSVRTALLSLLNPTTLVVAGILGVTAAAVSWGASAIQAAEETKSFEDRLNDLSAAVTAYKQHADIASQTTSELTAKFGAFGAQAGTASAALATIGRLDAIRSADSAVSALTERFGGLSRTSLVSTRGGIIKEIDDTFYNLRDTLALTDVQAATVVKSLEGLATADTMQAKVDAANALNASFVQVFGSVEAIPDELLNVQREALLVALEVAEIGKEIDKAADKISRMHEGYARSRLEAEKAMQTAQEMLTGLRQQAEMNRLIATYGRDSVQVAEARIRAERAAFAETTKALNVSESMKTELMDAWEAANGVASSNMTGTISSASRAAADLARNLGIALETAVSLGNAQSSKQYGGRGQDPRMFGDGGRLSGSNYQADQNYTSVNDLIDQLTKSSGGGRSSALSEEQRAIENLNKSLKDRLTSLQAEKMELELVASGQFQTVEAARLMAEAQAVMGSSVDQTTEALIRQIDAAQKSAIEMESAANAGAAGWLNAVPSYKEAGDKIQADVLDSLSNEIANFAKTGKFNFESLADSILSTMTRLAAELAVKEIFSGLLGGGGGAGGFFGTLISSFFAAEGGLTSSPVSVNAGPAVSPTVFRHAPQYAEGTANTSGIPAILHPNEAVIPLSKGRKIPVEMPNGGAGGGSPTVQNFTWHVQATDADSFRRSQKQIAADAARAGRMASAQND
ncbi:phage tail length tape measure family protein [Ruegeria sp. Ofav3-42]|uniref:phage tail length tape measure family protein n=1 Tax=Ruegeria sp. Ofav3-42 TaxID=2917759 RepID=UPI001EF69B5B|nr:phage tail length tape measure family protein [Ruegeria sp. Ofav3-42]MCG7518441.1 phage tail length tape measure family protein [Ruegeria sp. Ofav3-42]